MSQRQKTIAKEVSLSGVGLHTGSIVTLTLKPAPANHGFSFVRTDLEGHPEIPADASLVVSTERGTTLEKNGVRIYTTEHILAAMMGCDLDNIIIDIDAHELPIMDGSSKYFVEAVERAGIVEQDAERKEYIVKDVITYTDPVSGSEIMAVPADEFQVTTMVDFGTKILGTQNAYMQNISQFKAEIAQSRTFCFLHEVEMLYKNGLIKGGDLNNAIVYVDKEISDETLCRLKKIFNKDQVTVKPNGILDNLTLYYPNEAARHKLLDVMGDLSLVEMKIRGKIIATKPGHSINTQFAKKLSKIIKNEERNNVPKVDLTQPPLMTIEDIMKKLPHRPPFLLVDKIYELSENHIIGVKNVTMNEPFFVGHFPNKPIFPGVLQIEAMAQCGGILALGTVPDPENYLTIFMKIENAKFKNMVVPGDTVIFKLELMEPIKRGIVHMQGYGYVNGKIAIEAEMMALITKETSRESAKK